MGNGELWIGGLFSITIIVLLSFVYKFSYSFHHQYPIEKADESTFSCRSTPFNSKFHTSLQFLRLQSVEQVPVFSLLNSQQFTINVEFINTAYTCDDLTIESSVILTLPRTCHTESNMIFASLELPSQFLSLKFVFHGINTIGAVRMGLIGPGGYDEESTRRELNFSKLFFGNNQLLSQHPSIQLQLTEIINITEGLKIGDKTTYSGIWAPTFLFDMNQMFLSQEQYQTQEINLQTVISVTITKTPFFIKNEQKPIAKQPEIIFHTILFTGVCLDFVGMIILLLNLMVFPISKFLSKNYFLRRIESTR